MMSDLLKISLTFLIMLFLLRKKLNIGYVMLIASALLALLYRMDPANIFGTLRKAALNEVTLKLLLALSLIRSFELILRERKVLSEMMSDVKGFFQSRRAVIVSMPVLIGMLPSLGGAYFSAPMVKEATTGLRMSQEEKAFINYWFRHPWEFVLPLYPGILLASAVSGLPLYHLIGANLAYALVLLALGFIFSMRGMKEEGTAGQKEKPKRTGVKNGGISFLPVAAVLVMVVGIRVELHYALLLIVTALFIIYRYRPAEVLRVTRYGFAAEVILLIFGIMLFKEVMESSGAVKNLSLFFVEQGIPVLPVLCLLPFIAGLLTGHSVGFVGTTFPILINISGGAAMADISIAFAAGFAGVLLSPVHLCLVLTREYFKAELWGVYRKIIPATTIVFLAAIVEYLIAR